MARKAFLLTESLVCLLILSCLCLISVSLYTVIEKSREGEEEYRERMNGKLEETFMKIPGCKGCPLSDELD